MKTGRKLTIVVATEVTIAPATSVDASDRLFEQGKTYYARIYYFIPEIEETLSMDLQQVQLIVVRTRE